MIRLKNLAIRNGKKGLYLEGDTVSTIYFPFYDGNMLRIFKIGHERISRAKQVL